MAAAAVPGTKPICKESRVVLQSPENTMRVILAKRGNYSLKKDYRRLYSVCQKMSQVLPAIGLTHIHQFLQFLAGVISRDSKIGCRYNFLKYLAFTYFIML